MPRRDRRGNIAAAPGIALGRSTEDTSQGGLTHMDGNAPEDPTRGEPRSHAGLRGAVARHIRNNVYGLLALFIAMGGTAVAANTVGPKDIKKNAVRAKHIKGKQIRAKHIRGKQIRAKHLAPGAVRAKHLQAGAVSADHIAPGTITGAHVAADSLTGAQIDESTLTGVPFSGPAGGDLTGSFPNPGIASAAVTSGKLANGAVTADKLAAGSVGGTALANNAVTQAKLADGAVVSGKIGAGQVQAQHLANGVVTEQKLAADVLGLEQVEASSDYDSDALKSVQVSCPAGKEAVGGGAAISTSETAQSWSGAANMALSQSRPLRNTVTGRLLGWIAAAHEPGGMPDYTGNWRVIAFAICMRIP